MDVFRIPLSRGVLGLLLASGVGMGPVGCGDSEGGTETEGGTGTDGETEGGTETETETGTGGIEFEPAGGGLRRLTRSQYVESINLLLGRDAADAAYAAGLPVDSSLHDFDSIGSAQLALTTVGVEDYERAAAAAATQAVANPDRLANLAPCVVDGPQDASCYRTIAEQVGHVAWRRVLTEEELSPLLDIAEAAEEWAEGDFGAGVKYELMGILQSPNFVYMIEIGEPDADNPTHMRLTDNEFITRLSFFILGHNPNIQMLELAESGGLADDATTRAVVRELMGWPGARTSLANFYDELLHLRDLPGIGKNPERFPQFGDVLSDAMRESVLHLVEDVVWEKNADGRELFMADYAFVTPELAEVYGVEAGGGWNQVTPPAEHGRAGFFGSPAFLARFAHAEDTSPTRRGNFILAKFLCEEVPPPPQDVEPVLPDIDPDNPVTMKERLQIHMEDPSCSSCHKLMDPIGFALEHFDAIGQYRTEDFNMLPIDSFGEVEGLGSFNSPKEIGEVIYDDPMVAACFVSNFARGSMGHLETVGEHDHLQLVEDAFVEGGYSIQTLMEELVMSPVFRYVAVQE